MEKTCITSGFTVMEILVAAFILLLIGLMTFTAIKNLQPDFMLSGATREMASDFRLAQQMAVAEQIKYCVKLLFADKKYRLEKCDGSAVLSEKNLPSEIADFSSSGFENDSIEFNPYGAVREGGQITVINKNGRQKIIQVRPSGFVKISN